VIQFDILTLFPAMFTGPFTESIVKRAQDAGFRLDSASEDPGERLLAAVREAVDAGVDPELALRRAADRFKDEVDGA